MARTKLSTKRLVEIKSTHLGKIIIICEGKTEKYYFDYFAEIINKTSKYNNIEIVLESQMVMLRLF